MLEEKRGEISWNIIAEQTRFIAELLQKGTNYYLSGNIGQWFNILTAIRENVNYDLKKEEEDELNKIEIQCWAYQTSWNAYLKNVKDGKNTSDDINSKKKIYVMNVRQYSRRLLKILNKLGYFPKKEDRTKLSF
jgi:hypothetical protein